VVEHFSTIIGQLRVACFCTGSANLAALRVAPLQSQTSRGRSQPVSIERDNV